MRQKRKDDGKETNKAMVGGYLLRLRLNASLLASASMMPSPSLPLSVCACAYVSLSFFSVMLCTFVHVSFSNRQFRKYFLTVMGFFTFPLRRLQLEKTFSFIYNAISKSMKNNFDCIYYIHTQTHQPH